MRRDATGCDGVDTRLNTKDTLEHVKPRRSRRRKDGRSLCRCRRGWGRSQSPSRVWRQAGPSPRPSSPKGQSRLQSRPTRQDTIAGRCAVVLLLAYLLRLVSSWPLAFSSVLSQQAIAPLTAYCTEVWGPACAACRVFLGRATCREAKQGLSEETVQKGGGMRGK